jgi:DtxR family Mn-dependent transcriptional regulator
MSRSALFWVAASAVAATAVFLPGKGLLARLRAARRARARELGEDCLKYLLERKAGSSPVRVESLQGALKIGAAARVRLQGRMERQGLIRTEGEGMVLTTEGQRLALQVVRAHRLWERYLASEARLPLKRVHREAHRREHRTSGAELQAMEAALGYPPVDPHGDPIPRRDGTLPPSAGTPLTAWTAGRLGRIVHLEDEPPLAYAQILAEGLKLGQRIWILDVSAERYLLTDGESEFRLAPAVAANVYVEAPPAARERAAGAMPLSGLKDGRDGVVLDIDESCQGFTRRRFMDLGLTPGALVRPELSNAFGDPRAYRIRGTLIALRKDQAAMVLVRPAAAADAAKGGGE